LHHHQRSQHFPGVIEVSFVIEALQDLSQNQVANGQRLLPKQPVEYLGLRRDRPLEVIDPHAGIDEDQRSLRIASSTAARLVFRPVARSVSRISLSSITMFVRMDVYSYR